MSRPEEVKMTSVHEVNTLRGVPANAPKLAIGYIRVAAATQTDSGRQLDAQAAQIRTVADAHGLELIGIVGGSGEPAHNRKRPGLIELLSTVKAGQVNAVIVPDLSRLARKARDLHSLLKLFESRGVVLVSTAESLDTSTTAGRRRSRILCRLASIFE
jgi:DNA invertase Pin-like site-specific DNA recombinase